MTFPTKHSRHRRTSAAKRFKNVEHATAIIWRVLLVAESRFRKLSAPALGCAVFLGACYHDGKPAVPTHIMLEKAATLPYVSTRIDKTSLYGLGRSLEEITNLEAGCF